MSLEQTILPTAPRWRSYALWGVKGLLAAAFLAAGGAKLSGVAMMVENFERIGLGQWFRYLTGALEVLGAATILLPATAGLGAVLLICIMVGAVIAHVTVLGGTFAPALVLLVLSGVVAWNERRQIKAALNIGLGTDD